MPINLGSIRKLEEERKKLEQEKNNLNLVTNNSFQNTTSTNNNSERRWFDSGAFSDGYQFGDVTKTVLGTAGDIGTSLLKGVVRAGEDIGDLMAYGGAQIVDWLGNKEYADQVRQAASEDLTGKVFSGIDNALDKNSLLGEKSQNVVNSIGNMYAQAITSSKLLGSKGNIGLNFGGKKFNLPVTSVISGASSGMGEAYQKGAEDWQAWLNGAGSGLAEGISESLFGTFGLGGSDLDDFIVKSVTQNMKSGLAKSMAKAGIKAAGEGVEEVVSYLLDYGSKQALDYGKQALGLSGPNLAEKFSSEELWENFFSGALAAAIGGLPSTISEARGNTPQFNVNEGYRQNRVLLPTVQNNNTNNLNSMRYSLNENGINVPIANNDGTIVNPNRYQYVKSDNIKIDNLRKSASQYFNNSQETRNFMNTIEKVIADKNYNVIFDDTLKNKNGNSINAQITTNKNNEVEIKINPNSNRAGEFLLVHEITHAIETDSMKKLVLDYASKNSEFNTTLESLKQTYGTNDVNSEVLADISGQLFGNQEFINNLSMEQPNIFRRIYNKIIELANKITGNSHEALFIQDLKNKWENAYRNTITEQAVNNLNTNPVFSIQTDENGNRYVNVDTDQDIFAGKSLGEQNKIAKKYILDHFRGDELAFNDENINVNNKTATKYTNPKEKISKSNKNVKNRISTELDNLLSVSQKISESADKKSHAFAKDGWEYYETTFNIDGNYFTGILNIGKNGTQKTLYDITNIKKTTQNGKLDNSSVISNKSSFSDNNITNSQENVKSPSTRYSMQENQSDTSYRGEHQPDRMGVGYDLTSEGIIDDSIYTNPEWYAVMSEKSYRESYAVLNRVRNKPNANVTIYRATPSNEINPGDWVTLSRSYAQEHLERVLNNEGNIVKKVVKAKDIQWAGDDINEFGYFPDGDIKNSISNKTWQEYLEENYPARGTRTNMQNIKIPTMQDLQVIEDANLFSKQVDEVVNGTFNKNNHMTVLEHTPQVLQELGVKDYPITLTANKLDRIMNDSGNQNGEYHGLGIETVKKIPQALQTPLDIVKSHNNSYVLTTDLSDNQNRQVIASIKIDGKGYVNDIKINTNVMTSAYGRNNYDSWMKSHQENGDIVYDIDRGFITQKRDNVQGLQLPNEVISSDNNITQSNINVKLPSSNNSNMQNTVNNTQKIPTAQDIQRMENSNINLPNPTRVQNPLEISRLTPEDASTTPPLPSVRRNRVNDGESSFASNIQNKTNMLTEEQKNTILSDEEVRYYDKITNKDSLNEAFSKLNENGASETRNWFAKDSEKATATDVAEGWILLKQYADNNDSDGMVAVAKKLRDMGTKAGQTIQAFNIMARMTPEGMVKYVQSELSEAYDKMVKGKTQKWIDQHQKDFDLTPQETGAIMDIMKKVSTMEDGYNKRVELAKIQKIMTDKLPPTKGAGIKSWMRISMLFNPKTQIRNVAGNAVIAPVNYFSDLFASMADKVIGSKTGYRTTGITDVPNYVKGFKKGLYQSYNDLKQDINTRNIQGNRFEIGEGKSFNNNTIVGKALNRVDSLLSFMLDAGDRTFYEATFTNSINNQLVLNNTTEVTQDMIDIATQEALSRTWQDNNNYTKFVLDVRRGLNKINIKGYGLGDVLIPFAKTPANLTKAIVDYSPAGLVNTLIKGNRLKNAIETGQFTPQKQHDFVQSLGKATVGTMLYVAGYALAKAGIVSGESDDDKDVRDFMKNTLGVNSYSIKIGDMSFTYDWAQPIAAPLSIMANIVQKDKEDASTLEKIVSSLDTAGNILLEQSFMESINTALSNNDGLATGIEEAILDLPARAVPTLMKQIVDLTDGTQRQTFEYDKPLESMVNSVKAKIPGLSQTLAPSVDTMGREIRRYGGKNNIFNVFLNPANVSTENISESAGEIYRLYKETGNTNIMPRVAPYYINKNGEKITLNSSQRAKYQKTSGNIIETEVENLLSNSEYQKLSDEKKSDVISDIVNYSYNVAQKEVLGTELSDTYQKVYEYSKIGDISDYYSFRNSVDDTNQETKKESIANYLLNSTLSDKELASLYGSYYSSEETLEDMMTLKIPIKEFIKFDSQEFTTDYDSNGRAITNSKKNKLIRYVNSLNLSIAQKAILIKSEYSSYDDYDRQIVSYVNSQNLSKFDKAVLLKSIGFDDFNRYIVEEVNSRNISAKEKAEILEELGFRIVNGRVYW